MKLLINFMIFTYGSMNQLLFFWLKTARMSCRKDAWKRDGLFH